MKGRERGVVEAALCNLYRLGRINLSLMRPSKGVPAGSSQGLHPVERAIDVACARGVHDHRLMNDSEVKAALANFVYEARHKLALLGLLPGPLTYLWSLVFMGLTLLVIDGLGYIRLQRSLMRGYQNVAFLVILMLAAAVVTFVAYIPRMSRAGKRYITQLQREYRPLVRQMQAKHATSREPEVLYAIAACGAAALGGTMYASLSEAVKPPKRSGTWGDGCSGCGGGSCGGGGCGGGGCGGGGCGGG